MQTKPYLAIAFMACSMHQSHAQTNKSLSNLTSPTAINQSLLPDINNTKDLGSNALGWRNIYTSGRVFINNRLSMHAPASGNFFTGPDAGTSSPTGINNTGTGQFALGSITSGSSNTAGGYSALHNNTSGRDNTANGYFALYANSTGSYNTAAGTWALYYNSTGNHNTAYGYSALWQNQTGSDNVAIGKYAMYSNVKGFSNVALGTMTLFKSVRNTNTVAIGDSALYNFTGDLYSYESYTTAIGSKALYNAITGYENTAIGTRALYNTTKGAINTAVGVSAMFSNTEGLFNTAMGVTALSGNTTGDHNTGVGYATLQINKTGSQNTALGSYAGPNSYDLVSNSTSIGYLARATASNQVRLGNTEVTSIGGQVGWTTFSDGRYKRNIRENVPGLTFINALKPVTYTVDIHNLHAYLNKNMPADNRAKTNADTRTANAMDEAANIMYDGFIAQEVEAAAKQLGFTFSGVDKPRAKDGLYGLRYDNFVVPLVKAVQELSRQNDTLQAQNESLIKRIERLESMLPVNAGSAPPAFSKNNTANSAALYQNAPNPFAGSTTIRYALPQQFTSAHITVTDAAGKPVQQIKLSGAGNGTVTFNAASLASGTYTCSLVIDGKVTGTKQMVLLK